MSTDEKSILKPVRKIRPHVVILGAGASKQAMLEVDKLLGVDKFAKQIPLMDDLPEIAGFDNAWKQLILEASPPPKGNFENTFSWLIKKNIYSSQLSKIENIIESYFKNLDLPDCPTIYDYLVLGLRTKDIIAIFNWDSFLMQAYQRNKEILKLPDIRFLHGCVAFATCNEHDIIGMPYEGCPECNNELKRSKLLYPIEDKDYANDVFINRDWECVTKKLKEAFHLTIFGYSGPATDYKARELLLNSWGPDFDNFKKMCHVEIIDIKTSEEITKCWTDFIPYAHSMTPSNFWESSMARWPRRTFEWKYSVSFKSTPVKCIGPYKTNSLSELQDWFSKLNEVEYDEKI